MKNTIKKLAVLLVFLFAILISSCELEKDFIEKSVDNKGIQLKKISFSELKSNATIDIYRRNLQKAFVSKLIDAISLDKNATANFNGRKILITDTDLPSIARGQLIELKNQLKTASVTATDRLSKFHIQDLIARIENALNLNK
jgi:hypothetical protein